MKYDLRELGIQNLKFKGLREEQEQMLDKLLVSPHRLDVAALPTGVGKSLLGVAYAKMTGLRSVILTSTRALQDQYQKDFPELTDVRGMGNYPCRMLEGRTECDVGPCLDGESCVWKEAGCSYFDRVRRAQDAQVVVTNYAFWFAHQHDHILGKRELVILDEAHELDAELAGAAGVEFRPSEVNFHHNAADWDLADWRSWGTEKLRMTKEVMARPSTTPFDRRKLRRLADRLGRLVMASRWVWDYIPDRLVRFEPLNLAPYLTPLLSRGAAKVVMMSATVRPGMVSDLGLSEFGFNETDSPFPLERRPIYWVETGLRLNAQMSKRQQEEWVRKVDQVISSRLERKGLIHTVSYKRAQFLKARSKFADKMIVHRPSEAQTTVERFKRAKPPSILVSPVVHTGIDFPYEEARWQIVGKVPFPDTRSGIAAARTEKDPLWSKKFAARTLVQMAGRVVRASDDLGETIILDDNIKFLFSRHKTLFPRWWRQAFQPTVAIPKAWWTRGGKDAK